MIVVRTLAPDARRGSALRCGILPADEEADFAVPLEERVHPAKYPHDVPAPWGQTEEFRWDG
jgi:hypothetical protein